MVAHKRNPFHRDIDEAVEQAFIDNTDQDGNIDLDKVSESVATWYIGHPDALTAEARRIATLLVRQFDESRRPRPSARISGGVQLGLFRPHYLIPWARNRRVWMEQATREQFAAWMAIRADEAAQQSLAYSKIASYQSARFNAWTPDEQHLIDVERRYFGYGDDDPDEYDDDA